MINISQDFATVLPSELAGTKFFINWKNLINDKKKQLKVPVDKKGSAKGYDDPSLPMTIEDALTTAQEKSLGVGLTLNSGLQIYCGDKAGYLWCFDFDGFAEIGTENIDVGVIELLDSFNSYTEMSPSGTGFKVFLVSNKMPTTKTKIKFCESIFAETYPEVDKYRNRAVEVFSKNLFLALTGELFSKHKYKTIRFIDAEELERLIDNLDKVAKAGGGSGLALNKSPLGLTQAARGITNRLKKESIELVLSYIDSEDEQTWSDVVNAIARVYGEGGRDSFHFYSKRSEKYDENECNARYDRALNDLTARPEGYGTGRLLELARTNPNWTSPVLHNEVDTPSKLFVECSTRHQDCRQGITALELAKKVFPPLTWVVKDVLPEGCYLLSARPKVGKSWLALQICLAVAQGEPTLGKSVHQGRAVYLALEDNQRRLKDRLETLRPDGYQTNNLLLFTEWPKFDEGGIEELAKLIELQKPKLVVIDTLAKVRAISRNNNVYENDYKTLAPLTALANHHRICILVVHHNRKGKSECDALEQISGSLGLAGAVDGALVIDGVRTDKHYRMSLIGRDIPNDDELAIERSSNGEWKVLGNATQVFVSEERKAILDLLYTKPIGLKPKEIAELLGKKPSAVRKLLMGMNTDMQVVSSGGIYKHPSPMGSSNYGNGSI